MIGGRFVRVKSTTSRPACARKVPNAAPAGPPPRIATRCNIARTIRHGSKGFNVRSGRAGATVRLVAHPSPEELTQTVFELLRDEILSAGEGFTPQSNLVDAGLDSLAVTQLLLSVEERTGVWVDDSLLTPENLASAESLAALVCAQLEAS